jgi:predicted nucleotidyltransferase
VLLNAVVGSRAHGTATETSDWDIRKVFLQPTRRVLSLDGYERFIEAPEGDENGWELFHFLRLALRNNPFTLETLSVEPQASSPEGDELRSLFPKFLSRHRARAAFLGFATGQRKKMSSPDASERRRPKAMSHYLRVLFNGAELLRSGKMTIRIVDTPIATQVLAARRGDMTSEEAVSIGTRLEAELEEAFRMSPLPDDVDVTAINEFHWKVRRANW